MNRLLPWTDIVAAIGEEHFEQIRASLDFAHTRDLDRDAFLLNGSAAAMLRDLMPAEAPAEMVSAYGALLHMLYVMWARGWPIVEADEAQLRDAVLKSAPLSLGPSVARSFYLQLPERLVWAEPAEGESHEPLDGIFVIEAGDRVHALAVLGFREGREGFTTMEGAIRLPAPAPEKRVDGSAPFSSTISGGESAKLISVVDEHELAALALTRR
ncbi:MAG TPA: hypothetical protein VGI92_09560 [Gemmatimonadales bacterium]